MSGTDISIFTAMLTAGPQTDAYFGGCPVCGSEGNFANMAVTIGQPVRFTSRNGG